MQRAAAAVAAMKGSIEREDLHQMETFSQLKTIRILLQAHARRVAARLAAHTSISGQASPALQLGCSWAPTPACCDPWALCWLRAASPHGNSSPPPAGACGLGCSSSSACLHRGEAAAVAQQLLELPFVPLEAGRLRMCSAQAQHLHPALLDRLPRVSLASLRVTEVSSQ